MILVHSRVDCAVSVVVQLPLKLLDLLLQLVDRLLLLLDLLHLLLVLLLVLVVLTAESQPAMPRLSTASCTVLAVGL